MRIIKGMDTAQPKFISFGTALGVNSQSLSSQKDGTSLRDDWAIPHDEGELRVDIYQTDKELIVRSTIAGVKPENLEIFLHHDLLTIRGKRECEDMATAGQVFSQECYWGKFSRSIILPVDIKVDEVKSTLKHGLLTIALPKNQTDRSVPVTLIEE